MMSENLSQEEIDALLTQGLTDDGKDETASAVTAGPVAPKRRAATVTAMPQVASSAEIPVKAPEVRPVVFSEFSKSQPVDAPVAGMDVLLDVPLSISVELGRARCFVKDLLSLSVGSVVELDKAAGESVDLLVNGKVFAHGEVVVVDENFGVRLNDIVSKGAVDKGVRKMTQ